MATVTEGNPVTLDALFGGNAPANPAYVEFDVELPDETVVTYVFGTDAAVTNPGVGSFECAIGVPAQVGEIRWRAIGAGSSSDEPEETIYGTVYVIPSAVDPTPPRPPGPTLGPCQTWITGEDVAGCTQIEYGSNPAVFDTVAYEASMALFEISGRQFTGLCERTVRPCRQACGCFGAPSSLGFGPWYWTGSPWGYGAAWGWYNETGDQFGCKPMSYVKLAGYAREILEVRIDGVVMPEYDVDTGVRNWRLDKWRYLVRMDDPGNPFDTTRFWPGCQNMSLDDDQPGTFSVQYKWGVEPPQLARSAAIEIANQLFLACGGDVCVLPAGVTKVTRQGIEVERGLLANWFDPKKPTGLVNTDLFLKAYNPNRNRRRSAVWSPDVQQYARKVGT